MIELETESIRIAIDGDGIAMLTIDVPGQAANTMGPPFKAAFREVVSWLRRERERLRGVVITSAKKTFFAGGDLRTLVTVQPSEAKVFFDSLESFKVLLRGLEQFGMPVATAINGAALGGGWEICLCAHARFCLADQKLLLGLPEGTLGLLPGAGGVSRMVRKLGLRRALPLLVGGKTFSPAQALSWGLLDGIAEDMPAVIGAARQWVLANPRPRVAWDEPGFKIPGLEHDLAYIELHGAAELYADGHGHYPARRAIFANAVEGALVDIDTALRLETRYLTSLATGQVSKNMINTFFFQSNQIKSGKSRPADVERVPVRQLQVRGQSRSALSAAFASAARRVPSVIGVASSQAQAEVERALNEAVQVLAARELVSVVVAFGAPAVDDGLYVTDELKGAPACAAILLPGEATPPGTVPSQYIGIRAMPDLSSARVVEVVRGSESDAVHATRVYDFLQQIGKTPIMVSDAPRGFLRRIGAAAGQEGLALCREGLSSTFVRNVSSQTDMSQGVLALADRFCSDPQEAIPVSDRKLRDGPDVVREVEDRILFIQALEALRCLEEAVVLSVSDANIASIQGVGFPGWTGGVVQYVNQYGLAKFASRAAALARQNGERFSPPRLLLKLVESGAQAVES